MSHTFENSSLRKRTWFSLPAFAVIAASSALVIVADKAADAYSRRYSQHEPTPSERDSRSFEASGSSERQRVTPDRITWVMTIEHLAKTQIEAEQTLAARRPVALQSMLGNGVELADIVVEPLAIEEITKDITRRDRDGDEYDESIVTAYRATQSFIVTSRAVETSLAANKKLMAAAAAWQHVDAPTCTLGDTARLIKEVRAEAVVQARHHAEQVAGTLAKSKLGALVSVSAGGVEVQTQNACRQGLTIRATASATYRLK